MQRYFINDAIAEELRGMRFEVEADYDPAGLLGRDTSVRPGFEEVRLRVEIDADMTLEQKQEFLLGFHQSQGKDFR